MSIDSDYGGGHDEILGIVNTVQGVLRTFRTCVEERRLIALPTADYVEDTRLFGFSNDQLGVLKTYPTLGPNQPRISMRDEERKFILIQNLKSAQYRINRIGNPANNDSYRILVAGDTDSGKSAVINGLVRRNILPSGPMCHTSTFVEIADAQDTDGREEVHLCRKGMDYDCKDVNTFARGDIRNLHRIINNWNNTSYHTIYDAIKVYVNYRLVYTNFLGNSERKVHIIDSPCLNTGPDAIRSLLRQRDIDALMVLIDARSGVTTSIRSIMESYFRERTQIFVIITHLDRVCDCGGACSRSCKERRKRQIMHAINGISPETFALANQLIHCVNPTLVPLWDGNSDYATRQIPWEWAHMENCLRAVTPDQSHFQELFSIKNYLQMLMHDVILFARLNAAMVEPKIDDTTIKILQFEDSIERLEDGHDRAYMEAKDGINTTKNKAYIYILQRMNELRDNPERFVNRELINRIDPRSSEADLQRVLQQRWREVENEIIQKVDEYIQECKDYFDQLVKGLPNSSTHTDFIMIKTMLRDIDESGVRRPESSLKPKIQAMTQLVFSGLEQATMQTWAGIMYQTAINNMNKYAERGFGLIMNGNGRMGVSFDEEQENSQTPFDDMAAHLPPPAPAPLARSSTAHIGRGLARVAVAGAATAMGVPVEVISIAVVIVTKVAQELWKYFRKHSGASRDKIHRKAKEIVKEKLSEENLEYHTDRAAKKIEKHLFQLLDSKINHCFAAAMAEETRQFLECCEEIRRLNNDRGFFPQLNEEATQVYTSVNNLQL